MTHLEKKQRQTLNRLIDIYFKNHKEFCDKIPALKILKTQIISRYEKVNKSCTKTALNYLLSYRGIKLSKRAELSRAAFIVSSGLTAYARLTKNKVMLGAVNYCYSDIFRSTENTMIARCKQILQTAKRTKDLSIISFDCSLLKNLSTKIEEYENLMKDKDQVKDETKKHNRLVHKLLTESISLVEKNLTPLMIMLHEIYPADVQAYFYYNRVKNLPGRKKKRNKKKKTNSKIKMVQPNILQQKSSEDIMHRFAELAAAE
jgi:hypothetical protein